MEKIEIKNEKLKKFLEYNLNKQINESFYITELNTIFNLTLINDSSNFEHNDLSDLLNFNKLKNCTIKDFIINDNSIKILNKLSELETLHFDNCTFKLSQETLSLKLNKLIFSFCNDINLNIIKSKDTITYLRITSGNNINLDFIENFNGLNHLILQSIIINDISFINSLKDLKELNLNGSKILKNKKYITDLKHTINIEFNKTNLPI